MDKKTYHLQPILHTPVREALKSLKKLISFRTGVVKRIYEILPKVDEARAFYFSAEVTETKNILGENFPKEVGGGGYERESAIAAAIGECVERYCGIYIPKEKLVFGNFKQIGSICVNPEEFALFSEQQYKEKGFPYKPFNKNSRVGWVEGFSLPECESVYLPAQLVYLSSSLKILREQPIGYTTNSRLACGPTLEEAILSALLELIERDAFMITWWNKLTLPVVDINSLEQEVIEKINKTFGPTGLQYKVVDLSVFTGIPTFLGIVRNCYSEFVPMAIGAASSLDSQKAILKALLGAYHTRSLMKKIYMEEREKIFKTPNEVRSFRDGLLWWCQKENVPNAKFLDSSNSKIKNVFSINYKTVLDGILAIVKKLELQGIKCYAVDVTTPDIQQCGLYVVKVVCPGLCQLNAAHKLRFFGGNRLYSRAYEVGLLDRVVTEEELNYFPHPFP